MAAGVGSVSSEATVLNRASLSWRTRRQVRRELDAGRLPTDPSTAAYAAALATDLDRTSVRFNPASRWGLLIACAVLVVLNALAGSWLGMAGMALIGANQAWTVLVMPRRWARYPILAQQALELLGDDERHDVATRVDRPFQISRNQLLLGRVVSGVATFVFSLALMTLLDQLTTSPIGLTAGTIISAAMAVVLVATWALRARGPALAEFGSKTVPRS